MEEVEFDPKRPPDWLAGAADPKRPPPDDVVGVADDPNSPVPLAGFDGVPNPVVGVLVVPKSPGLTGSSGFAVPNKFAFGGSPLSDGFDPKRPAEEDLGVPNSPSGGLSSFFTGVPKSPPDCALVAPELG